jgi:hypothetical protein
MTTRPQAVEDNAASPGEALRFRKRPVVIDAMLFDGTVASAGAIARWANASDEAEGHDDATVSYLTNASEPDTAFDMVIQTLEGGMSASVGDWIIRGVKGEFYACKPDIFAMTYEPATPAPAKADRLAIQMLVAAGFVTEAKANEALQIAHGFDAGPLAPAKADAVVTDAMVERGAQKLAALNGHVGQMWQHYVIEARECLEAALQSSAPAREGDGQSEVPVGTVTRVDRGNEVADHLIELTDAFDESLYRYDAGTVFNLYATPSADAARHLLQRAHAAMAAAPEKANEGERQTGEGLIGCRSTCASGAAESSVDQAARAVGELEEIESGCDDEHNPRADARPTH